MKLSLPILILIFSMHFTKALITLLKTNPIELSTLIHLESEMDIENLEVPEEDSEVKNHQLSAIFNYAAKRGLRITFFNNSSLTHFMEIPNPPPEYKYK